MTNAKLYGSGFSGFTTVRDAHYGLSYWEARDAWIARGKLRQDAATAERARRAEYLQRAGLPQRQAS